MNSSQKGRYRLYEAIFGMTCSDRTAALDHYFTNFKEGCPFIIAGGSAILKLMLKKYFRGHSAY